MHLRSSLIAVVLVGSTLLPATLRAEDVYLKNGRVFRGVIATVEDGVVRIEMPGGTLSFPVTSVSRIEASDAVYREYQSKREALEHSKADAAAWLELAKWAKAQGLEPAAREAGMAAGRLDPGAPGVRPFLAELGFVFDAASGGFLTFEESMARQGLVYDGGVWIPSAEREARRERARAGEMALAAAPAERPEVAVERSSAVEPDEIVGIPFSYSGYGGGAWWPGGGSLPGGVVRPHGPGHRPPVDRPPGGGGVTPPRPAPQPQPAPVATSARRTRGN